MPEEKTSKAGSWSRYWETTQDTGAGCLPGASAPVASAVEEVWQAFFAALDSGARVLDLGTGGFAVPKVAQSVRSDLRLVGVDYAQTLPPAPQGLDVHAGVALEALPFEDNSFDAVTSQFALEYADGEAAVAELCRVLRPGGRVMIIAHHADGFVRHHNEGRLSAIRDLMADGSLVPAALDAKRLGVSGERETHVRLDGILRELQARHGKMGVVTEVLQLLAPMLLSPDGEPGLKLLAEDLTLEADRLAALSKAALDRVHATALAEAVGNAVTVSLRELMAPGQERPIAWLMG